LLHDRGKCIEAVSAEAAELLGNTESLSTPRVLQANHEILNIVELCVERIANCVAAALAATGRPDMATKMQAAISQAHPAGGMPYPSITLWPLLPGGGQLANFAEQLRSSDEIMSAIDAGERPAGRLYFDDEMSDLFFAHRRYSSARFAIRTYEDEANLLGEPLESLELSDKQFRQIIVAEVLGLIARWSPDEHVRSAAAVASSGLRSAFWLWLEDDDRAMGVLRVVLEATARLRTHARKPPKARKLESRGDLTTPRDWLEAAGWRQLYALNKALGELAHTRPTSKWQGARGLLVSLQPDTVDPEIAPFRGRTFAMDTMVRLVSHTALEVLQGISPILRNHVHVLMDNTGIFDDKVEHEINAWLSRSNALRGFNYGPSGFDRPSDSRTVLPPEEYERLMQAEPDRERQ
jgi:hypothetical protein